MDLQGCTALITGASAGLGTEFARQLSGRAGSIVLVARRRERLEELRDELTKQDPNLVVHVRAADLSKTDEVEALCGWLEEQRIAVNLLVNNAGLGDHGPFVTSEPARLNEMLHVNVVALTLLTRRVLPAMVAAKRGGILNVSSSASFLPLPRMAVYAASKAYVTSFSEALRTELHRTGVSVTALCPGPVHTEFGDLAARPNERKETAPEFVYVSAEEVVRAGLTALEHNRPLVVPGWPIRLAMLLVRLTPMPILRLASRISR
jgi:short-subunit dehydrogenase